MPQKIKIIKNPNDNGSVNNKKGDNIILEIEMQLARFFIGIIKIKE